MFGLAVLDSLLKKCKVSFIKKKKRKSRQRKCPHVGRKIHMHTLLMRYELYSHQLGQPQGIGTFVCMNQNKVV